VIHSYGSVYALGHAAIGELLFDPVVVEEKIDGSQFSFGVIDGELMARSKGKHLVLDEPDKMFGPAVDVVRALASKLTPNWVYRGEYLQRPRHNTLGYERIPAQHIAIFDIASGLEEYLSADQKRVEAERLGLEVVPLMYLGRVESAEQVGQFLTHTSFLGGPRVEGVVVKNYLRFTKDKHIMMGKFVSEAFKEQHAESWRKANPTRGDIVQQIIERFRTEPRWRKAVQHIRERGELTDSPRDIGPLLREVGTDIHSELADEIKELLFKHAWPQIQRGVTAGLPEWYKKVLLDRQFAECKEGCP
jgi:hypothetical protein